MGFILTFLEHSENTLIEQIHNEPTHAKTDSKPFLTILGTRIRAKRQRRTSFDRLVKRKKKQKYSLAR
jgi:hypothetical protein